MDAVTSPPLPGSNAERSRAWNRGLVLGHLTASGPSGRAEIARSSGLSTQAVSNIIADLEAEGLIREAGRRAAGRGLPAVLYGIAPEGGYALGIELRPDAVRGAILDLSGALKWTGRRALVRAEPATVADRVTSLRDEGIAATGIAPSRLLGAGVVMPGPFGRTGLADAATELPGWAGTDPVALFARELGVPVIVENDANAAAVAERISGAARSLSSYVYIYFGTGLGLGIVDQGKLIRGAFGNAGEIGHLPSGRRRLEDVASRLALGRRLAAAGLAHETVEDLAAAVGHPAMERWLDDAAAALSRAVTVLENLLDPGTIILGGSLPDTVIDALIARIALSPASLANRPDRALPRLIRGASGRLTATLGAGALVINNAFTPSLSQP